MSTLAPGVTVLERGWLSSNNIVVIGRQHCAVVDTGYCTHAAQTLALIERSLGERNLDLIVNTHLHSDHCGGNAALQARYPQSRTLIPPGQAQAVRVWDEPTLSYQATGQQCPRFGFDALLTPGQEVALGDALWQVHAAPGHDAHSVILFEPVSRTLISADALWHNGFGVVFEELEGAHAFDDVARTLDLIESLAPHTVIPGHGKVFTDVAAALDRARQRLGSFVRNPQRHAAHGIKVLLKFKLLELQRVRRAAFMQWAVATPYVQQVHSRYFVDTAPDAWLAQMLQELVHAGAAQVHDGWLANT